MKISIITSCFNAENFIHETIESVLSQRGDFDIEYILIDGGSSDRTLAVIEKYAKWIKDGAYPQRAKRITMDFYSEKDNGVYDGLAKGFQRVTGDILAYINADDFYLPNAFSCVVDVFTDLADVQWLTGMPVNYNEKGQITQCCMPLRYRRDFIRKGIYGPLLPFIQQESSFWRRELMSGVDFSKWRQFKLAGDFYLWHHFAGQAQLDIVQSCLAGFRNRSGQLSDQMDKYLGELKLIAEPMTGLDSLQARSWRKLNPWIPDRIKLTLNPDLISFRQNRWEKIKNQKNTSAPYVSA